MAVLIGKYLLVSDMPVEVHLSNKVFNLILQVVTLFGIVSIIPMETTIPSLVAPFSLCPDRVGGPKKSLVSDLEENLCPKPRRSEPHKEIASDGWASGIPWTSAANRPTNRARGSSLPCVRPRSNVVVTLGRELARKLSLNSLARESTEEMDDSLSRLYHIRAGPLRVVGKAWHIRESEVS
ncbi:hypothetical protein B296_00045486 [Ensete ventricosum]|uniref:Uncharacterized protein n=1 Tax=Ensete ventricosum TaxID=4639 RepID=A0A426XJF2_ENSVE|nr:hypothetical protein B296_00045486 [Ensete ventricosum]